MRSLYRLLLWSILPMLLALGLSTTVLLMTPEPRDPWRDQPAPPEGEYLLADDGAELFLRRWLPSGKVAQVVLGLHGLGQHSGYHQAAGESLAASGVAYYALDSRGNGWTRTKHGDLPSVERLYDDLDLLVAQLEERYPEARVYVLGHSLGAATAAAWAAERQPDIGGLLVLAPAMTAEAAPVPWLNWVKGPAAWMLFRQRTALQIDDQAYSRERLAPKINLPEELDRMEADPMQLKGMSMAFALAAKQVRETAIPLAGEIRVPALVLVGDADPALPGAQEFFEALAVPDKRWVTVPGASHMLFQIREREQVMAQVVEWLRAH